MSGVPSPQAASSAERPLPSPAQQYVVPTPLVQLAANAGNVIRPTLSPQNKMYVMPPSPHVILPDPVPIPSKSTPGESNGDVKQENTSVSSIPERVATVGDIEVNGDNPFQVPVFNFQIFFQNKKH